MNRLDRFAPVLVTTGVVVWLESIFTIEWTYPYCLDRADGPAYAAQGMPLPYWMWDGVSSLEYSFVPHTYVLNIFLLSLLLFPLVRVVFERAVSRTGLRRVIFGAGGLLLASHFAFTVVMISTGYLRPTTSLSLDGYYSYSDFRPARIGFHRSNTPDCTPSRFWFPNGWQHD
jgi:hypothetical protein